MRPPSLTSVASCPAIRFPKPPLRPCLYQHSDSAVHSLALVRAIFDLVSLPVAGGLGFLGALSYTFGPVLFAQGAMLAGLIASNVLYHGGQLLSFKIQAGGFVLFFVFVIFGPLLMFTPQMGSTRRKGLADYGLFAQRYVEGFRDKWIPGDTVNSEDLLGTGDIQSLADLGNSYTVVQEMRLVPFTLKDVSRLAAATAAPMVPLLFLVWSPEEVIMQVVKTVF